MSKLKTTEIILNEDEKNLIYNLIVLLNRDNKLNKYCVDSNVLMNLAKRIINMKIQNKTINSDEYKGYF